jgi:hypothetical protein
MVFRASAMVASVAALALPARADDLLATLSLDMSSETAWPTATEQPTQTADASTPAPTIPPTNTTPAAKPESAAAQPAPAPVQQTAQTPPPASPAPAAQNQQQNQQKLSQAQLSQLVAPIALYPDPLLSQVLMASTYPLEVVEAARWVEQPANKELKGEALLNAAKSQNWDPSVTALVPFPRVLQTMSTQISWTQNLGNAFLAQQSDVMATVQQLRQDAMKAGNLKQTAECGCQIKTSGKFISIEPVTAQHVVVPAYSPTVAYGEWLYPGYPPFAFPAPVGFAFAPGVAVGWYPPVYLAAAFDPWWNWGWFNWGGGYIAVDPGRYSVIGGDRLAGGTWVHDPAHRGGVAYANAAVATRFNGARMAAMHASATHAAATGHFGATRAAADPAAAAMHGSTFTHGQGTALHAGASAARFHASHAAATFHGGGAFHGGAAFHGRAAFHGGGAFHGGAIHGGAIHAAHAAGPAHFGGGFHGGGAPHGGGGGHPGGGGGHHR